MSCLLAPHGGQPRRHAALYMLDTNVFNDLLDGLISMSILPEGRFLVTGVQPDELERTKNAERRAALLGKFKDVNPEVRLAASFAFDIEGAGWGQADWNDGSGRYEEMLKRLKVLDRQAGKRPKPLNQIRDIVIGETAIKVGAKLISRDHNLRLVIHEFGGQALDLKERKTVPTAATEHGPNSES